MATYIAGSIFIFLSIVWWVIKKKSEKDAKNEQAKKDLDSAIDKRDWDAIDDARMRIK